MPLPAHHLKGNGTDYDRPPTVPDARNMDDTLYMGELVLNQSWN